jgi:hypothetical protein
MKLQRKPGGAPKSKLGPRKIRQTVLFRPDEFAHIEAITDEPGPWMRDIAIKAAKKAIKP